MDFGDKIKEIFDNLPSTLGRGTEGEGSEINIPHKLEQINTRRKTLFTSTISDER
jgi:hypothetical protein